MKWIMYFLLLFTTVGVVVINQRVMELRSVHKEPELVLAVNSSGDLSFSGEAPLPEITFEDDDYDFSFKDGCEIMIELIHENHRFFEKRGFVVTGDKWRADIHPKDAPDGYSAIAFTIDKDTDELAKE